MFFRKTNQQAFTLIEILIVITVIGLVAGVVLVQLNNAQAQARDARRMADLRAIQQGLEKYYIDTDIYPLSTQNYEISGASWGGNWPGYLELVPRDPLSSKQQYIYVSDDGKNYQLYAKFETENIDSILACGSCGADGQYNAGIVGGPNSFLFSFSTQETLEGQPTFAIPQGRQVYNIRGGHASPQFKQAIVDPVDVHVGDLQKMSVWVIEQDAGKYITEATANVETDTGFKLYALSLTTGTNTDGWWEGSWKVQDTHSRKYLTEFTAKNNAGETAKVTITWSDPCAPPPGGNWTLDGNCSITGVNGVDNGNYTGASGLTLTLQADSTFVWNSGFSITIAGSTIALGDGAQLKKTNLWMLDADADGYASSTTQIAQDTAPTDGRRRNVMNSTSTADCDSSASTKYQNLSCYSVSSCQPSGPASTCVGATCESIAGNYTATPTFKVFVSSATYTGNIGGTASGDANCQTLANNASLGGSWTAWLAVSGTNKPSTRGMATCASVSSTSVAWYLVDGTTKIDDNWADLTSGTIDEPINKNESGASVTGLAWTSLTGVEGVPGGGSDSCTGWTSSDSVSKGWSGNTATSGAKWSQDTKPACNNTGRLYCFQHAP